MYYRQQRVLPTVFAFLYQRIWWSLMRALPTAACTTDSNARYRWLNSFYQRIWSWVTRVLPAAASTTDSSICYRRFFIRRFGGVSRVHYGRPRVLPTAAYATDCKRVFYQRIRWCVTRALPVAACVAGGRVKYRRVGVYWAVTVSLPRNN